MTRPHMTHKLGALAALSVIAAATLPAFISALSANEAVLVESAPVTIEVDQGQLLRLEDAAVGVFVAQPQIADIQLQSPLELYIYGKTVGQTSLFVTGEDGRIILARKVVVHHDTQGLSAALERSGLGTSSRVESYDGGLSLSGEVPDIATAVDIDAMAQGHVGQGGQVLNRLEVPASQQVHLRVKVAEVSRSAAKRFGFRWQQIFQTGATQLAWGFGAGITGESLNEFGGVPRGLSGTVDKGPVTGTGILEAMETEGLVTVLAEPNLTAVSGETASFLAGGEVPIPVPSGLGTVGVEYKNYGISLSFTPVILNENRISLRVRPEVSSLQAGSTTIQGYNIPALLTRRAETTVELASGQSFAIGGLLRRDLNQSTGEFPGLGDVPILGALFRSNEFRSEESELVIIVTPYIVRPVSVAELSTPWDGFRPARDFDRLVYGRLYRNQIASGLARPVGVDGGGLAGAAGFILE